MPGADNLQANEPYDSCKAWENNTVFWNSKYMENVCCLQAKTILRDKNNNYLAFYTLYDFKTVINRP